MALLVKDKLEVKGIKFLSSNSNKEILTSIVAEELDAGLLKAAARVRLKLILPTIFGLTLLFGKRIDQMEAVSFSGLQVSFLANQK